MQAVVCNPAALINYAFHKILCTYIPEVDRKWGNLQSDTCKTLKYLFHREFVFGRVAS